MDYETYCCLTNDDAFCHAPSVIKYITKSQGPSAPFVEAPCQYSLHVSGSLKFVRFTSTETELANGAPYSRVPETSLGNEWVVIWGSAWV